MPGQAETSERLSSFGPAALKVTAACACDSDLGNVAQVHADRSYNVRCTQSRCIHCPGSGRLTVRHTLFWQLFKQKGHFRQRRWLGLELTVMASMILLISTLLQNSEEKAVHVEHPAVLSRSACSPKKCRVKMDFEQCITDLRREDARRRSISMQSYGC